ncbi:MAG: hypothetical protein JW990_04090 [Thermoleophilia bacterium]|nr:hypothetical protein [Thermoleophilia bacterium]
MDSEVESSLPEVCRSFRRSALKLSRAFEAVVASDALHFELSWRQGESPQSMFVENPALVRLATLLRPFMMPTSPIEFRRVWSRLAEEGLVGEASRERVDALIATAETPAVRVVLNDEEISVRDLHLAYGEGILFDCVPEAEKTLELLTLGPMEHMVPFLFYNSCLTYSETVLAIGEAIREAEHRGAIDTAEGRHEPRCIYCLTRDGDFRSEDHVIPESLGNDELVLRDAVCDVCNNRLSGLEQFLLDFEPVALLRVLNVPYTKQDRPPRGDFRDFTMQRVKPREIHFISKTEKDVFVHEDSPPGLSRFTIPILSRRPFDPILLGRALFKIGLGLVAYDRGMEFACDRRYDPTRDFIAGSCGMPNHLLVEQTVMPNQSLSTAWQDVGFATPVWLGLFGLRLSFNLDATPYPVAGVALPEGFMQFWLGGENHD